MAELEGLSFEIEAKASDGTKGIDALAKSLGKLKKVTDNLQLDKLSGLGRVLDGLKNVGEVKISSNVATQLGKISESLDKIKLGDIERLEDLGKALRDISEVGDVKIPKVKVPTTGVAPVTPTGTVAPDTSQATTSATETTQAVEQAIGKTNILKSIVSGMGGVFSKAFSLGTGALHKLGNALNKVKSMAAKAKANLGKIKDVLGSAFASKVKQNTSGLGQLFSSIKRIAMYRLIRAAFAALTKAMKEGINNLYQYSQLMGGTFAGSMDKLATSTSYLKNSMGAMAAPIINALAPAIDFVIDKVAALLNMINMLFARLSGASVFTAAKKNAKSYGDSIAGAGGSAAKAAKEIRDATTGIDELNIIMDKGNDGGGGGGGADYGSMFEELPIDNNISEFADKLKQAFDNADWKTLGTLLGDKVNELVDGINYESIGHKLGFGINGAIQTAYYFLKTVDFHKIGQHMAELLNSALEEVDTTFIGRTIVRWFTLKWDFWMGFLGELDWGLLARKFSDCVKGAFDEATDWLNGYDWSQVGTDLWNNFKEVVTNIDWGGIVSSIFTFLGTAIRSAGKFLGGFFGHIGKDIKKWWDKEIKGENWKQTAKNLLKAIGEGFKDIGTWVIENIAYPFLDALTGGYFTESIDEAGGNIVEGFFKGIGKAIKNVGTWIKTNIVDPFVKWVKNLFGIHSPSTVMAEIGKYITEGLLEGILAPFKAIGTWVKENILKPLQNAFDGADLAKFTVGVKNTAKQWWDNVKSWWANKVGAVESFTTSVKNQATTWWENTKTWWSGKVGKGKEFTTAVTNQASTWWTNVKTWWSGKVGAVQQFTTSVKNESSTWWTNVKTWWSGKVGAVQQFTTSLKNDATSWWSSCKTWWSGKVGEVQKFTTSVRDDSTTWWNNVKTWWSGKVGNLMVSVAIKNEASTWWSNVKSWWNNAAGYLTTTLNVKTPHIKVNWATATAFGKRFDYPTGFNLQWYAKGGILDGAQIFGMLGNSFLGGGEAGREAVLPLETHTEWMDTLAEKVRNGLPDDGADGISYAGFKRAMADFYAEYVQGTMNQMAADMNKQANKKEQTNVQIGNRAITDAVVTQQDANGYRFTT